MQNISSSAHGVTAELLLSRRTCLPQGIWIIVPQGMSTMGKLGTKGEHLYYDVQVTTWAVLVDCHCSFLPQFTQTGCVIDVMTMSSLVTFSTALGYDPVRTTSSTLEEKKRGKSDPKEVSSHDDRYSTGSTP